VISSFKQIASCSRLKAGSAPFVLLFCLWMSGALTPSPLLAQTQLVRPVPTSHMQALQLIKENKKQEALAYINEYLEKSPNDPQMNFWKAKLLYESPVASDKELGIQLYMSLSDNYPELAEPHNNLGVIAAQDGNYAKAVNYFEMALRANPDYALANENLADVYVQMAKLQYTNAIAHDPANKSARRKLDQITTPRAAPSTQAGPASDLQSLKN
jgi:tetratricopeptide (TPR) repeat protein